MASNLTLAQCWQKKNEFLNTNGSNRTLVDFGMHGGGLLSSVLTPAGEQEFARQNPDCAAMILSCALPWEPGGSGSYRTVATGLPENPTNYTWNTEADRQAWINAHPHCAPYPPSVASVVSASVIAANNRSGTELTEQPITAPLSLWDRTPMAVKVVAGIAIIGGSVWLGAKMIRSSR